MIISDHLLMGSVIGLSGQPFDGYILAASIGGSLLPDIDLVHGSAGTIGYLDKHRTYTHSIWLAPVFSFLPAIIIYGGSFVLKFLFGFRPVDSVLTLWLWCFLGALGHLLVDILNPFGTTIWWPKKDRVATDVLFTFDPAFAFILILGLVVMLRKLFLPDWIGMERYQIALVTILVLVVYVLLRIRDRIDFKKNVKDQFEHLLEKAKKVGSVQDL